MVLRLKVNLFKSSLSGVNLKNDFLEAVVVFLHCTVNLLPIKFLGIMVGVSPRKVKTWKSILDVVRSRLIVWRGKHLSIGGRVVMINYMLNVLPIYTLSFYKVPVNILKELINIQSRFLWG
ncbi:unnamed protein product [Lathyrus sativus]|nr:unnamed protein product [Lathyrus sativus]